MKYHYRAKDKKGKTVEGEIETPSEKEAAKIIGEKGLYLFNLKPESGFNFELNFFQRKVSLKDKIVFTKELAMMTKGGLPLVEALDALKEQSESKKFAGVISDISESVKGGVALSDAMSKHPEVFPPIYVSVTKSGEKSGKLDEVLSRLADQLQKDYDLVAKIKSAVSYPVVIVCSLVGIMVLMLVFVIPQLKSIFTEMGVALPVTTQAIITTSDFMIRFWYIVILGLIALILLFKYLAGTPAGSKLIDSFKIKVPIFGTLSRKIYMARFTRTMGTLVASGLPMLEIIDTVKEVVGNVIFAEIFQQMHKDVESGVPLSLAMKKNKNFPAMVSQMVSMGEKSGQTEEVLFGLADFYDKEVDNMTNNLTSMIEPILIILIGGAVGVGIASVIMPMYSLVGAL